MKKYILLAIIGMGSLLLALTACNKTNEDDKPLDSLYQTQWQGTLHRQQATSPITMAFTTDTTGAVVYQDYTYTLEYTKTDKVIHIESRPYSVFNGDWWIYKITQSQLELHSTPNSAIGNKQLILILNRTY